jgi:hypothetical protein
LGAAGEPLSYYDIMLKPLAQALNAAISPNTTVYFSMQASNLLEAAASG